MDGAQRGHALGPRRGHRAGAARAGRRGGREGPPDPAQLAAQRARAALVLPRGRGALVGRAPRAPRPSGSPRPRPDGSGRALGGAAVPRLHARQARSRAAPAAGGRWPALCASVRPDQTWEIGHIGGHRFAATFMAFPHGLVFGRVPAARGPEIVDGARARRDRARAPAGPRRRPVGGPGRRRPRPAAARAPRPRRARRRARRRLGRHAAARRRRAAAGDGRAPRRRAAADLLRRRAREPSPAYELVDLA